MGCSTRTGKYHVKFRSLKKTDGRQIEEPQRKKIILSLVRVSRSLDARLIPMIYKNINISRGFLHKFASLHINKELFVSYAQDVIIDRFLTWSSIEESDEIDFVVKLLEEGKLLRHVQFVAIPEIIGTCLRLV
jgi:hypothetical protein